MKLLNNIWVFSDSIKGHEVQSVALANKLSDNITLFHCTIRQPWLSFAPRILPRFGKNIIWEKTKPDVSQPPKAIITCGRRMAAIAKYYKRQLNCKHIQILNPGDDPKKYDLLICPEHDGIEGENIITTKGSLHEISLISLAKIKCSDKTDNTVALFLGNPGELFFKTLDQLALDIKKYFPTHKIIICGSRRTPKKYHDQINESFNQAKLVWLSEKDGENPYMNLLACSQVLIVSADSINMVSEACATDKPVIVVGQEKISPKHNRFLASLKNRLSKFSKVNTNNSPLVEMHKITKRIVNKFN